MNEEKTTLSKIESYLQDSIGYMKKGDKLSAQMTLRYAQIEYDKSKNKTSNPEKEVCLKTFYNYFKSISKTK